MNSDARYRLPIMFLVLLTLLVALWAGLYRIGWALPRLRPGLPSNHGPLMISGFLGTLIALERAVALRKGWAYAAPLLAGVGALALIVNGTSQVGPLLLTLSSFGFLIVSVVMVRIQLALYTATMALGAGAWFIGNALWLAGWSIPEVVYWWVGFLVLTIVGERLELSRVARHGSQSRITFSTAIGLVIAGLTLSLFAYTAGVRLASVGLLALALWLLAYDIARRNIRRSGLTRFIALNLVLGYGWLVVGGVLGLMYAGVMAGPTYDAWLHALFLGFVLSLIFAHALIIFPAITGLSVPYHPAFYGPVLLLNLSLIMRVTSDLALWVPGRRWGGLLNVVAVLWFLLMVAVFAARQKLASRRAS